MISVFQRGFSGLLLKKPAEIRRMLKAGTVVTGSFCCSPLSKGHEFSSNADVQVSV